MNNPNETVGFNINNLAPYEYQQAVGNISYRYCNRIDWYGEFDYSIRHNMLSERHLEGNEGLNDDLTCIERTFEYVYGENETVTVFEQYIGSLSEILRERVQHEPDLNQIISYCYYIQGLAEHAAAIATRNVPDLREPSGTNGVKARKDRVSFALTQFVETVTHVMQKTEIPLNTQADVEVDEARKADYASRSMPDGVHMSYKYKVTGAINDSYKRVINRWVTDFNEIIGWEMLDLPPSALFSYKERPPEKLLLAQWMEEQGIPMTEFTLRNIKFFMGKSDEFIDTLARCSRGDFNAQSLQLARDLNTMVALAAEISPDDIAHFLPQEPACRLVQDSERINPLHRQIASVCRTYGVTLPQWALMQRMLWRTLKDHYTSGQHFNPRKWGYTNQIKGIVESYYIPTRWVPKQVLTNH